MSYNVQNKMLLFTYYKGAPKIVHTKAYYTLGVLAHFSVLSYQLLCFLYNKKHESTRTNTIVCNEPKKYCIKTEFCYGILLYLLSAYPHILALLPWALQAGETYLNQNKAKNKNKK